jgi:coenzyme Q-binding protein COQ10
MTTFSETRILPHTADFMFSVVADVERYPEFLPWCTGVKILSRQKEGARTIVMAEMAVGYKGFSERYTSQVTLDPEARTIDVVQAKGGPFRTLENNWRFVPVGPKGRKCEVHFRIEFAFRNPLLGMVAGRAFERVQASMARAFAARARALALTEKAAQQA